MSRRAHVSPVVQISFFGLSCQLSIPSEVLLPSTNEIPKKKESYCSTPYLLTSFLSLQNSWIFMLVTFPMNSRGNAYNKYIQSKCRRKSATLGRWRWGVIRKSPYREKNLKKKSYMYMYNWITLLYTWN